MRVLSAILLILACGFVAPSTPLLAQFGASMTGPNILIRGQLYADGPVPFNGMQIELSRRGEPTAYAAIADAAGAFSLPSVPPGNYQVRVTDNAGRTLHSGFKTVTRNEAEFGIRVRYTKPQRPASGTVSIERLQHKVPRKAAKAFRRALRAKASGDREKMLDRLIEAVNIDPDFYEGHAHLGLALLKSGQAEQSLVHFKRTAALDSNNPEPYAYNSLALYQLRSYREAEMAARQALRLGQNDKLSHYALALALSAQDRLYEEAIASFQIASPDYAYAHLEAARFHCRRHQPFAAYTELKRYLDTGAQAQREEVRQWAEQLRKESSVALALRYGNGGGE